MRGMQTLNYTVHLCGVRVGVGEHDLRCAKSRVVSSVARDGGGLRGSRAQFLVITVLFCVTNRGLNNS